MERTPTMSRDLSPEDGAYSQEPKSIPPTQAPMPAAAPPVRFTYDTSAVPPPPAPAPAPHLPSAATQPVYRPVAPAPVSSAPALPQRPAPVDEPEALSLWTVAFVLALVVGAGLAFVTVPAWLPTLGASITGAEPKVYWYLSRATGIISFVLLWMSMASGLLISNKMARKWPGAFTAFDLHQYTSLLGLAFIIVHVIVLLGNQYVPYNLFQLLVPFATDVYRPLWIAIGQVALYIFLPVTFTFYIRRQLGNRTWHIIHYLSYGVFALSLLHSIFSGTDTGNAWISGMYWICTISLVVLTIYRVRVAQQAAAR